MNAKINPAKTFLIAILAVCSSILYSQSNQMPQAPHGGKIQQADNYFIEFQFSTDTSYAFILDKNFMPTSNLGVKGEISFQQPDSTVRFYARKLTIRI